MKKIELTLTEEIKLETALEEMVRHCDRELSFWKASDDVAKDDYIKIWTKERETFEKLLAKIKGEWYCII